LGADLHGRRRPHGSRLDYPPGRTAQRGRGWGNRCCRSDRGSFPRATGGPQPAGPMEPKYGLMGSSRLDRDGTSARQVPGRESRRGGSGCRSGKSLPLSTSGPGLGSGAVFSLRPPDDAAICPRLGRREE
jgi:hypothetical protein